MVPPNSADASHTAKSDAGDLASELHRPRFGVCQFAELLQLVDFNVISAERATDPVEQILTRKNVLVSCYFALEALILETALIRTPALYASEGFRLQPIGDRYVAFLAATGRSGEAPRAEIDKIIALRNALTHSRQAKPAIAALDAAIASAEVLRLANRLRHVAAWLWQGKPPVGFTGVSLP